MAEREGFEPPDPCGSAVFKTAAFDRSATSPHNRIGQLERISGRMYPASIQHGATPRTPDSRESSSRAAQRFAEVRAQALPAASLRPDAERMYADLVRTLSIPYADPCGGQLVLDYGWTTLPPITVVAT